MKMPVTINVEYAIQDINNTRLNLSYLLINTRSISKPERFLFLNIDSIEKRCL